MAERHYDARYGWQMCIRDAEWEHCDPPFTTIEEAIVYALERLESRDDSLHAVVVDARAALDWAVERMPPDPALSDAR